MKRSHYHLTAFLILSHSFSIKKKNQQQKNEPFLSPLLLSQKDTLSLKNSCNIDISQPFSKAILIKTTQIKLVFTAAQAEVKNKIKNDSSKNFPVKLLFHPIALSAHASQPWRETQDHNYREKTNKQKRKSQSKPLKFLHSDILLAKRSSLQ